MRNDPLKSVMKEYMPIFCGKCQTYLGTVKRANSEKEVQELRFKIGGKCPHCGKELRQKVKKGSFCRALFRRPQT